MMYRLKHLAKLGSYVTDGYTDKGVFADDIEFRLGQTRRFANGGLLGNYEAGKGVTSPKFFPDDTVFRVATLFHSGVQFSQAQNVAAAIDAHRDVWERAKVTDQIFLVVYETVNGTVQTAEIRKGIEDQLFLSPRPVRIIHISPFMDTLKTVLSNEKRVQEIIDLPEIGTPKPKVPAE